MSLPRGRTISLTPGRRYMGDLLRASQRVPLVAVERHCRLADVVTARDRLAARPSWFAVFLKAWALVSQRRPELRRSYLSFPWPRLYESACNVAHLTVSRRVGDDDTVLGIHVRHAEQCSLAAIDAWIRRCRTEPVETFGDFRRALLIGRLPWPLRRLIWWAGLEVSGRWREQFAGTFGVTGVAALGSASLHLLSPLTTTITYGVFTADGSVPVRLFYDHRVLDGVQPADALGDLEDTLRGPIRDELIAAGHGNLPATRRAA